MDRLEGLLRQRFPDALALRNGTAILKELEIMKSMEPHRSESVVYLNGAISWWQGGAPYPSMTELQLFKAEDNGGITILKHMLQNEASGGGWHLAYDEASVTCGAIVLVLKDRLQRARPYQAARHLDDPSGLSIRLATSAQTPSLPSGHAFQTYCTAAAVLESYGTSSMGFTAAYDSELMAAVFRLAWDIGDRRTLHGVHFPSDNYAAATVFNDIVAAAWPKAHRLFGLRFARNAEERAALCDGAVYPAMCRTPLKNATALVEILE